jgi:TPR repeat protein
MASRPQPRFCGRHDNRLTTHDVIKVVGIGAIENIVHIGSKERRLLRCANASDPQCMGTLGLLYWSGFGHPPDFESAKFWLERAVQAGQPDAAHYLPRVVRREKRADGIM